MREFFSTIFHTGEAPQGRGEARACSAHRRARRFVLGIAPGGWEARAQARKTGSGTAAATDSGVKKTAKTETTKTEGPKSEGTRVNVVRYAAIAPGRKEG